MFKFNYIPDKMNLLTVVLLGLLTCCRSYQQHDILDNFNMTAIGEILKIGSPWKYLNTSLGFFDLDDSEYGPFQQLVRKALSTAGISKQCKKVTEQLFSTLLEGQIWPLKFLDATAKLPAGIAEGILRFLGSYDQCMSIERPLNSAGGQIIKSHYCPVRLVPTQKMMNIMFDFLRLQRITKPFPIDIYWRWDLCLPRDCSGQEIGHLINTTLKALVPNLITIQVEDCRTNDQQELDAVHKTAISILAILGIVVLSGTALDATLQILKNFEFISSVRDASINGALPTKLLISFSVYTNARSLLRTDLDKERLRVLDGIRFISMIWVLIGHSYMFIHWFLLANLFTLFSWVKQFILQILLNCSLSADAFFLISGVLVAYGGLKTLKKHGRINWGFYYLHRIWRLTPAYGLIIVFSLLWPLLGNGPLWIDDNVDRIDNCRTYWWTSLLYISNFFPTSKMCLLHGWYLSVDMQFYLVSPIILFSMYKKPKIGFIINFVFLLTSVLTSIVLGSVEDLSSGDYFIQENSALDMLQDLLMKPYYRMTPYCIGLYLGYFFSTTREFNLKLQWHTLLWCVTIVANVTIMYALISWTSGPQNPTPVNIVYLTMHRAVWSLSLAWIVLSCSTGHGGIVNRILSWSGFGPLSRVTYVVYLIHPLIQTFFSGEQREPIVYRHTIWIFVFLGYLCLSYGLAFLASLAVEIPFLEIEKHLVARFGKRNETTKNGEEKLNGHSEDHCSASVESDKRPLCT